MTNNIRAFEENTRSVSRDVEQHIIPELNDITPIPDAMVKMRTGGRNNSPRVNELYRRNM